MKSNRFAAGALLLAGTLLGIPAFAAQGPAANSTLSPDSTTVYPPLQDWPVDSKAFIAKLVKPKASTDLVTVYRPLTPCRLFDTRGFPAAIVVPGPFAANSTTTITPAGACGIPNSPYTRALSLAISVQKVVAPGGYIAFQGVGEPVTAITSVLANEWTGTTANVSIGGLGAFDIYLSSVSAHVIVDVNGYYQDANELDADVQIDWSGSTTGNLFSIINSGIGTAFTADANNGASTAVRLTAAGTGGTALQIAAGSVRASGAGVGSNTFASIHQVNTAIYPTGTICGAGFPGFSVFDNPQSNGDPNAILIITGRRNEAGGVNAPNVAMEAYYYPSGSCTSAQVNGKWLIHRLDNAAYTNATQYNVLVIKP